MNEVEVYAEGICRLSACAPKGADAEEVERRINLVRPTGIENRWQVAEEPFKGGEPNPCRCHANVERMHWLLAC